MNRKYTKEQFLENLTKIRKAIPEIALACDVIVGFPGESEEEFEETYSFIKECGFNYLHVFPYSIRPGTVAAKMKNQVNPQVKKERVARLIELGNDLKEEYESKFVGREVDVIVETYNPKTNLFKGYSSNYLEVHLSSENDVRGKYLKVIYNR
jgi:threonylcarbamoyladenosine tRNA methylthiotransferase MtaB